MRAVKLGLERSRGTIGLAGATYGAAVLALLTSVVLTREMAPSDFGAYRYVVAVLGLVAVVANVGIPYSAARSLSQLQPAAQPKLVTASLQLVLAALLVAAVLLALISLLTTDILEVSPLLLLASALVWTIALQRHFMYMLRGAGRTREIAVQTVLPPAFIFAATGLLAVAHDAVSLTAVLIIMSTAYLSTHVWTSTRLSVWGYQGLAVQRARLMETQKSTGLPIYKGALISVGVAELIVVLGGAHVGEVSFGTFALALSMAAPVATLPTVIGMVQFRKFGSQSQLPRRLVVSMFSRSALLGLAGTGAGWLLFPFIFPRDFDTARTMFPVLAVGFLLHGTGDYLNQYLQAQGDGLSIKRAAYAVGLVNMIVGVATIPWLGAWGLVLTKFLGSASYAASMVVQTQRWNHAAR
ncbi:oligosaccharide flippase family protein [Janibacter sp. YIM B02568]|uniref:lipopolysaccharide biosynthesis protein n=1 Tax=Janibacter endophyticus TaxID=2806261 RepID=UPI00195176D4|nr:oligosaccharide flippase family protein [Janibacter endophyticus]MBM6545750.1 oligosaccharide flippase family protein [Janibacter endophyticus]